MNQTKHSICLLRRSPSDWRRCSATIFDRSLQHIAERLLSSALCINARIIIIICDNYYYYYYYYQSMISHIKVNNKFKTLPRKPWLTPGLANCFHKKEKIYTKFIKKPTDKNKDEYIIIIIIIIIVKTTTESTTYLYSSLAITISLHYYTVLLLFLYYFYYYYYYYYYHYYYYLRLVTCRNFPAIMPYLSLAARDELSRLTWLTESS